MLWGDVDEAIKAERLLRVQRIERLSTVCALFCLSGAIWLAWPVLKDAFVGAASLLTGLGMPVLVLLWGIVIQDLILDDPRARTRIGAASSIIWPVFLMFSLRSFLKYSRYRGIIAVCRIGLFDVPNISKYTERRHRRHAFQGNDDRDWSIDHTRDIGG